MRNFSQSVGSAQSFNWIVEKLLKELITQTCHHLLVFTSKGHILSKVIVPFQKQISRNVNMSATFQIDCLKL